MAVYSNDVARISAVAAATFPGAAAAIACGTALPFHIHRWPTTHTLKYGAQCTAHVLGISSDPPPSTSVTL